MLLIRIKRNGLLIGHGGLYVHKQVHMKVGFLCIDNPIILLMITCSLSWSLFSIKADIHGDAW